MKIFNETAYETPSQGLNYEVSIELFVKTSFHSHQTFGLIHVGSGSLVYSTTRKPLVVGILI